MGYLLHYRCTVHLWVSQFSYLRIFLFFHGEQWEALRSVISRDAFPALVRRHRTVL